MIEPCTASDRKPARRILTLDGGGIRGLFALGILEEIETQLRQRTGRSDLVLADEFDFFAGTSTGAIIAACLAWGMPVSEIIALYKDHGRSMFHRERVWRRLRAFYRAESLARLFQKIFSESDGTPATLGSSRVRTMLLVVMRNASSGS
ncbi:MAG TPA: patatin-like phospholipase family protein, partial [Tepidisphaeraceae bacterium]|nr:patatin-like phospholipase family protein [Tepidisphaeraceae bacterium]